MTQHKKERDATNQTRQGKTNRIGRKPYSVDIRTLSKSDWNYFLGIYFADGNLGRKYETKFCLQGNEKDIAEKLAQLIRKTGLSPHIRFGESGKDDIIVRAYSIRLVELLPNKKTLLRDAGARQEFFDKNELLMPENGIPFLAGLLDGDGCCPVSLRKKRGARGMDKWGWSFRQTRLPFLIDYITAFVGLISSENLRVTIQEDGRKRTIWFRKSATIALLDAGLSKYSFKVASWCEKNARIEEHLAEYVTTGETARILNVSDFTVRKWIATRKLKTCPESADTTEKRWSYVSREELEKFRLKISQEEKELESTKRDSIRLVDLAKTLEISYSMLYKQYRRGQLQAILVHQMGPHHTYLVVRRPEAEKFMKRLLRERKKVENVKSKGLGIKEAAKILGVKRDTLYGAYRHKKLQAILVSEYSGKGHRRYLIVPEKEVDSLKMKHQALTYYRPRD